jgi:hypothetical protein
MNAPARCGLESDIGFMTCYGMRTLAHECLVVPLRLQVYVFWISRASSIGQKLLSEIDEFQGMKTKPTQL